MRGGGEWGGEAGEGFLHSRFGSCEMLCRGMQGARARASILTPPHPPKPVFLSLQFMPLILPLIYPCLLMIVLVLGDLPCALSLVNILVGDLARELAPA